MARPKELLRAARIDVAKRQRHCSASKHHVIEGGEICLLFEENLRKKNYCRACALKILERAKDQLAGLLLQFDGDLQCAEPGSDPRLSK